MFGYICVNKPEMKIRDFEEYNSFYCGLCRSLKKRTGRLGQMTLTYDMTFLSILLTGLYEDKTTCTCERCSVRPWRKMKKQQNRWTAYAADMNVLLASYNLEDDWLDEKSIKGFVLSRLLSSRRKRIEKQYPRQSQAVSRYLEALHECEASRSPDLDLAAGLTGKMLAEIFVCEEDIWSDSLRKMGFFLGKFIYLMDAYEDMEEDKKSGGYNPWLTLPQDEFLEDSCLQILTMMISEASKAFETLPILLHADILRNILYSGVWSKYENIHNKRTGKTESPGQE